MQSKKPSLLSRYEDPTGEFSNQSLQMATWYAQHQYTLKKIVVIFLVVWSAATLGTSLFFVGRYFIFDYSRDQANLKNLSFSYISPDVIERFEPTPLTFTSPQIFSGIENRYDFLVTAGNPNDSWIATVRYRFEYANGETAEAEMVLLPKQEWPLAIFGHEETTRPSSADFRVLSVAWSRVDPHLIPNPSTYIMERIDVSVDGFVYRPASASPLQGTPTVEFAITNHSLFDYWEFSGVVGLMRGGEIVGYSPIVVSQFKGGETRTVSLGVLSSVSSIDSVTFISLLNVFDPGIFMTQ